MAIVEVRSTVSARYYEKRRRADVIHAINSMSDALKIARPAVAYIEGCDKQSLINIAMALHAKFPEGT